MKICTVFVVLIGLCETACSRSVTLPLSPDSPVMVYMLATNGERTLQPGSTAHAKLTDWLALNQRGWSPYMITPPAHGILVRAPGLNLQVLDSEVLAKTSDGVFTKRITSPELRFLVE